MEKTEYEARILKINPNDFIAKLESLRATKEDDYHYRRYVYSFHPKVYEKWIRLRTNGKKTTLTIKELKDHSIGGTKEKEVVVSDFDMTNEILKDLGYEPECYQENKRTRYHLNGVEIDIDSWPRIPPYVEIEGSSEEEVILTAEKLGFSKEDLITLDVENIFRQIYHIDISTIPVLKF